MHHVDHDHQTSIRSLTTRGVVGGILMGLANLVPGISGGTMLLAAGIYPRFIRAISELSRLKFSVRSLLVLAIVVIPALAAFIGLAGPVKNLVVDHRWAMYSLFIGLTLGGAPLLWRMIGKHTLDSIIGVIVGVIAMALLAMYQSRNAGETADRDGFVFMFVAGIAGASAMILPGVSGGYLLLLLGVYVPILSAVAMFKDALPVVGEYNWSALCDAGFSVVLPVGLGIVIGIATVSNALRWCLNRFERATLGLLLGLLLGAIIGLYPFQKGVEPSVGDSLKGQTIVLNEDNELAFDETGRPVEHEDYPLSYFRPSAVQIAIAVALIAGGFVFSIGVAWIGSDETDNPESA